MSFELTDVLDDCKAAQLRRLDVAGRTVLHLGVSRSAHFEEFERLAGPSANHIAVRARHVDVDGPSRVQWADRRDDGVFDIRSGEVDILWADQSLERLWPEEIPTFLAEVRRLLSANGLFVLAGVNREIAGDAPRPARALELTWAEVVAVLLAAGFDIISPKGLLLGADRAGRALTTSASLAEADLDIIARSIAGVEAPERCSGWWVVVRDSSRAADVERVDGLLRHAGAVTARRKLEITGAPGLPSRRASGRVFWEGVAGAPLLIGEGVRTPLRAGRYRATVQVQRTGEVAGADVLGAVEAVFGEGGVAAGRVELQASDFPPDVWAPVEVEFRLERPVDDFRVRVTGAGTCLLRVERRLDLSALFWAQVEGDPIRRRPDFPGRVAPARRRSR